MPVRRESTIRCPAQSVHGMQVEGKKNNPGQRLHQKRTGGEIEERPEEEANEAARGGQDDGT